MFSNTWTQFTWEMCREKELTSQGAKNLGLKTSLIGKWEEGVGIWERASDFRKIRLRGRGEGDSLSQSLVWGLLLGCFPQREATPAPQRH